MTFLKTLADQIGSQFSLSENTTTSLDSVVDGKNVKYGALGDFASKFDQSATRNYLEQGYLRRDAYNTDPKQMEILMQQPDATILVKKRMFGSNADNYRVDFMDAEEKMYFKAIKFLFQNKCKRIAVLEKLGKIQKITSASGNVGNEILPLLFTLTDQANANLDPMSTNNDLKSLTSVINQVRKLYSFNSPNLSTTWITDNSDLYKSQLGEGTGVIEITNFTGFNTGCSVKTGSTGESFNLSITDPYETMTITEHDIEIALSDATNNFYNHKISQFSQEASVGHITELQKRLNTYRSFRKASPLTFSINPDTLIGKRVTVIVDKTGDEINFNYDSVSALTIGLSGQGVTVADDYLLNKGRLGFSGLDETVFGKDSEYSLFQNLIKGIFTKLSEDASSRNAFQTSNIKTNYARKKLKFNFLGKLIIQPMDSIHFYINSHSKFDDKIFGGLKQLFNAGSAFQAFGQSVIDVKNQFDMLFNPSANVNMQFEKAAFVGKDFPNYLWAMLRSQFINEKEGTHVYGGVVKTSKSSYNNGFFSVSVSGFDNKTYLSMGKVNFKPATDTFNGAFFDPLTPFKSNFDTVSSNFKDETPELLEENKFLLGSSQDTNTPLVKFKLGPNAGRASNEDNLIQDHTVDPVTKQFVKTFFAPDGLVYKWKEGIGSFVQFGSSLDMNNPANIGAPSIAKDPFAGQDVMNVISLCITGQPYNFATYWRTVTAFDGTQRDPYSRKDVAHSFYDFLKKDLLKNNAIWGNFIPFKTLSINERAFASAQISVATLADTNAQIKDKLKKLNTLENQMTPYGIHAYSDSSDTEVQKLATDFYQRTKPVIDKLNQEIDELVKQTQDSNNTFINIGDEVILDANAFSDDNNDPLNIIKRQNLRRQVNLLTRRMSYNVRANDDKNLFIVDDSYDKDYDLIAFNKDLEGSLKLYNNAFSDVSTKVKDAAELLNLEVYCDTQGHLRSRAPQYNRMPSSVFHRMMYLKSTIGIQIFPQFLEDLFVTQIKSLREKIEIIEDKIRLDCAVLGKYKDEDCVNFVIEKANSNKGESFQFISNDDGHITDVSDIKVDTSLTKNSQDLTTKAAKQAQSTNNLFTSAQRFNFIRDSLKQKNEAIGIASDNNNKNSSDTIYYQGNFTVEVSDSINDPNPKSRVNSLLARIKAKSGVNIAKSYFFEDITSVDVAQPKYIDVFKITNDLGVHLNERQRAVKLFAMTLKNSQDYKSLDDPATANQISGQLLLPGVYGNKNIPEVFEHMLEDETYDDYGPGSGKRFIIKNSQIRDLTIEENPPPFTLVEVHGTLNQFASEASSLPPGLAGAFPQGGNALVSALAIDYDMWRTYGFLGQSPVNAPFLSNPQTQCAPYAASILSRARKNILRGTVTISGNEYMQPGEVVFIEGKGLLFYVESVKHNFIYSSDFTTILELSYGHTPGEYIPTYLDIIGKALYNNKDSGNLQIQRQSSSFSEASVGVIVNDPNNSNVVSDSKIPNFGGTYQDANISVINNILYTIGYKINQNSSSSNNIKASIELRIYYDGSIASGSFSDLQVIADNIKDLMEGGAYLNNINRKNSQQQAPTLPKDSVMIVAIDLNDSKLHNSPSQKAWDSVRNIMGTYSPTSTKGNILDKFSDPSHPSVLTQRSNRDKLSKTLFTSIIDCWVKFETIPTPSINRTNLQKAPVVEPAGQHNTHSLDNPPKNSL